MPVRRKTKTQYVEHYEEHVGAEMRPFVALLAMEANQTEKDANPSFTGSLTTNAHPHSDGKRKVRFWKRIAAFFS